MEPVPLTLLRHVSLLFLFLSPPASASSGVDEYTWEQRKVPLVQDKRTVRLKASGFSADPQLEVRGSCGIECQRDLPDPSPRDLEETLSYETMYENGTRTLTSVILQEYTPGEENGSVPSASRRKREVYGPDTRFTISEKQYSMRYPFSTTVKVSTGCTGVLVSPKHVLTAAHCIHDGTDYIKGAQRLRVGVLRDRKRGGKGKRGGRSKKKEEVTDQRDTEPERKAGARRNRRIRSAPAGKPNFRWTRVRKTQIPKGWFKGVSGGLGADYDYAVLELKKAQKTQPMELGIVASVKRLPAARIHFSGFDDDRPGQLVYRFCSVSDESGDLLYQHCDAQPGASGAGVYVRLREPGRKRGWKRRVIGVFSGHRWVRENGGRQDYNVVVRITPPKYAQICHWVHQDSSACQNT